MGTSRLTGSEVAVVEAASVVVGRRPWPQAWSVDRLCAVCNGMTSMSREGRDKTGQRKVTPVIWKGDLVLCAPVALETALLLAREERVLPG